MIKKVSNTEKEGNSHISILYPGNFLTSNDSGIGSIGRIDHASINRGTTIKMHPHINDEILSYFRYGNVEHLDSHGNKETLTENKLMLMKSGKVFHHEEKILDRLEGLQIFIRPQIKDYKPEVIFYDLESKFSDNVWRLIASNHSKRKLQFTSETEVFDIRITNSDIFNLPDSSIQNPISILYLFKGTAIVNDNIELQEGECLIINNEEVNIQTQSKAELVCFFTNPDQECYKDGMFSGNQM